MTSSAGVTYTLHGVANHHLTLAITNPRVGPSGSSLQINAYNASNANLGGTTFNVSPTQINFIPATSGVITVVVSPYQANATGTFTLTYATDVTGALTSGAPVDGALRYQGQRTAYTVNGVAGQHLTLAVTNPVMTIAGTSLQIDAYNASNANLGGTTFNVNPMQINFTPSTSGVITVVISPYQANATGSFTLTYATDVTGALTSGMPVDGALRYQGQHTAYTVNGVAGQHLTLAITRPVMTVSGTSLQLNAYNASNANLGGTTFNVNPTQINFTPSTSGVITVVISPYQANATGSFTLTYAKDVTGSLTSGTPLDGALSYQGQHADYTFNGVAGQHVTLAITHPMMTVPGTSLQLNAYNASNANLGGTTFNVNPTQISFTPSTSGVITVVISPYQANATGSYTLTLTAG